MFFLHANTIMHTSVLTVEGDGICILHAGFVRASWMIASGGFRLLTDSPAAVIGRLSVRRKANRIAADF
jgi:hypothetical protein